MKSCDDHPLTFAQPVFDGPLTAAPCCGTNRADLHLIVGPDDKDDGALGSLLDGTLRDQYDAGSHGAQNADFYKLPREQDTIRIREDHAKVSGAGGRTHADLQQIKLAFMRVCAAVRECDDTAEFVECRPLNPTSRTVPEPFEHKCFRSARVHIHRI